MSVDLQSHLPAGIGLATQMSKPFHTQYFGVIAIFTRATYSFSIHVFDPPTILKLSTPTDLHIPVDSDECPETSFYSFKD